jgi:demethylmenaquinone methyltransferase/2-methoxy-6-polyprenyl-1,4-benzoquinol methylase
MADQHHPPEEEWATEVRNLFSAIAPRYDLINDLQSLGLHRRWKRRLVALTGAAPGTSALDLCCGTGDIAFALAQRGARTIALDFSSPMLAMAMSRAQRHRPAADGASSLNPCTATPWFVRADALKLPFAQVQFDAVTLGYGLRNLASLDKGLREMRRVTKPGGQLLILEFGKPQNSLWRAVYFLYLRTVVHMVARLFCSQAAAYTYIIKSLERYPGQNAVADLMRQAGFSRVKVINLLGGIMSINAGQVSQADPLTGGGPSPSVSQAGAAGTEACRESS